MHSRWSDMILFGLKMGRYDGITAQHLPDRSLDIRCHGMSIANCRIIIGVMPINTEPRDRK